MEIHFCKEFDFTTANFTGFFFMKLLIFLLIFIHFTFLLLILIDAFILGEFLKYENIYIFISTFIFITVL